MNTARPIVKISSDGDAFSHAAAERITDVLGKTLREKEFASFVLTGGKTPKPVYQLLRTNPYAGKVDWNRVHFFWGDERCVAPEDPESNFGMAWSTFLSCLNVPSTHLHRIPGEVRDPEKAALFYESEIRNILSGSPIPSFDLVLLGMGEDGHTASLFPGTQWDEKRLVVANRVPGTAAARISMTPRLLNEAESIIFLVAGRNKSGTVAEVFKGRFSHLPASRIKPVRGSLIWMLDDSAAGLLN